MEQKELKRLNRAELLELLLEQTQLREALQAELDKTQALLADRDLKIQESGNLAEAVIRINGVMEAAEAAASLYRDNIRHMEEQAKAKSEKILGDARKEAQKILDEAQAEVRRITSSVSKPVSPAPGKQTSHKKPAKRASRKKR